MLWIVIGLINILYISASIALILIFNAQRGEKERTVRQSRSAFLHGLKANLLQPQTVEPGHRRFNR